MVKPNLLRAASVTLTAAAMAVGLLVAAHASSAAPGIVEREAAGANPDGIQAAVDAFRADLGGSNNGVGNTFPDGRREINWDGVPDNLSAPNNMPADLFRGRGAVFSTPGSGFRVSADSSNPTNTPVRFGNFDPTFATTFSTFSPERWTNTGNARRERKPDDEYGKEEQTMKTINKVISGTLWLGRGTATVVGLAVTLALLLGVSTTALAAIPGDPFKLGEANLIRSTTALVASVGGPALVVENDQSNRAATALSLEMANPNLAPMRVNATGHVANLNADALDGKDSTSFANGAGGKANDADRLDGKDASAFLGATGKAQDADKLDGKDSAQIGVNGWERDVAVSAHNSDSPKTAIASCPEGKFVVGTGYNISGGVSGSSPNNTQTDVVVHELSAYSSSVNVMALEETPTSANWLVTATAICATAP